MTRTRPSLATPAMLTALAIGSVSLAALAVTVPAQATTHESSARAGVPKPAYAVSLRANLTEAISKETVIQLKGRVPGAEKGDRVTLQLQYADTSRWRSLKTATLSAKRKFAFQDTAASDRTRSYRVVKPGDATHAKGVSKEREVVVYAWRPLDGISLSASENVAYYTLPINGETYGHTIYATTAAATGFAEYTLGRKCLTLRATFGLSDRTVTGGQGRVAVTADGQSLYSHDFALGQDDPRELDVADVYRVRLDFSQLNGTPATEPSAGDAQVLCRN